MRKSLRNINKLLDSVNKDTPVEEAFLSDLKRSIELDDKKNSRVPSQTYKPSSMNCIRNMYYQVTGTQEDESDTGYSLIGICNSGTDIHERIQKYVDSMKDNNMDCEYVDVAEYVTENHLDYLDVVSKNGMETKLFHKDLNMSFLCDGIIKYKGKYYILELKTESSYSWMNRKGVDPKHHAQGIAYSVAFGILDVIFVYISRDVLDMKAFMFTPTAEMKTSMLTKIKTCDEYVSRETPPPIQQGLPKKACTYCSYKSQCHVDGDEEMEYPFLLAYE